MPPEPVIPISSTPYVIEEKASATYTPYISHDGESSTGTLALPSQQINAKSHTIYRSTVGQRAARFIKSLHSNYINRDLTAMKSFIDTYSSYKLSAKQLNDLAVVANKNNIKIQSLSETIVNARLFMQVTTIEFMALNDSSSTDSDFFVRFKLDTSKVPRIEQFDKYIAGYLGHLDINKTKVHISVI